MKLCSVVYSAVILLLLFFFMTQTHRNRNVIYLITSDTEQVVFSIPFSLHSIVVVKMRTLLKCIAESDIVMILKQSAAGKAGCSLQLASLFCQHYFKRLQYNSISMKMLYSSYVCCETCI